MNLNKQTFNTPLEIILSSGSEDPSVFLSIFFLFFLVIFFFTQCHYEFVSRRGFLHFVLSSRPTQFESQLLRNEELECNGMGDCYWVR